jgi:hypothetical protein
VNVRRGVEQWLARWAHNPKVGGSSPPPATNEYGHAYIHTRRGVEQWLARRAHNPEVGGSSPPSAITDFLLVLNVRRRSSAYHSRSNFKNLCVGVRRFSWRFVGVATRLLHGAMFFYGCQQKTTRRERSLIRAVLCGTFCSNASLHPGLFPPFPLPNSMFLNLLNQLQKAIDMDMMVRTEHIFLRGDEGGCM